MARSELSRLRDIAYKRIRRAERRGEAALPSFPTIQEAKKSGQLKKLEADLRRWLQPPAELPEVPAQLSDKEERRKQKHREAQRRYYETAIKPLTKKQKALLKGAKTMGLHIPPRMAKQYEQYVKARYDLGLDKEYYGIVRYAEDFVEAIQKKVSPDQLYEDFQLFLDNVKALKIKSKETLSASEGRKTLQKLIDKTLGRKEPTEVD